MKKASQREKANKQKANGKETKCKMQCQKNNKNANELYFAFCSRRRFAYLFFCLLNFAAEGVLFICLLLFALCLLKVLLNLI